MLKISARPTGKCFDGARIVFHSINRINKPKKPLKAM
jgi:hypothetical protein